MRRMTRWLGAIFMAVAAALSGCGGSGDSPGKTSPRPSDNGRTDAATQPPDSRFPSGTWEGERIVYGARSPYGSMNSGGMFLDAKCSAYVPKKTLEAPGSLKGHWLDKDADSELVIEKYDAKKADHASWRDDGFGEDAFIILIKAKGQVVQKQLLNAAYGSFSAYGVDVDGDGIDEVAIESGMGRGTFAYQRTLRISQCQRSQFQDVFGILLNGYLDGEPRDGRRLPDPDVWERRYAFARRPQGPGLSIYVYLIPPEPLPWYIGHAEQVSILQLPKMLYSYNSDLRTFELADLEFRRLR
jgi:hypothetical protein